MYSIHKLTLAAMLLALAVGCQATWTRPQAVNERPLLVDEAMQIRTWPQSVVYYPSNGVTAGPVIGLPWEEQTYRGAYWEPTHTAQPPLEAIPY